MSSRESAKGMTQATETLIKKKKKKNWGKKAMSLGLVCLQWYAYEDLWDKKSIKVLSEVLLSIRESISKINEYARYLGKTINKMKPSRYVALLKSSLICNRHVGGFHHF